MYNLSSSSLSSVIGLTGAPRFPMKLALERMPGLFDASSLSRAEVLVRLYVYMLRRLRRKRVISIDVILSHPKESA